MLYVTQFQASDWLSISRKFNKNVLRLNVITTPEVLISYKQC
jgi:hypothetical protein